MQGILGFSRRRVNIRTVIPVYLNCIDCGGKILPCSLYLYFYKVETNTGNNDTLGESMLNYLVILKSCSKALCCLCADNTVFRRSVESQSLQRKSFCTVHC